MSIGDPTVPNWTSFGTPGTNIGLMVGLSGNQNGIVGTVNNNLPTGTAAFPTGVTGHGRLNSVGGAVFGLFGRADLYSAGTATNELNTFNYAGPPSGSLQANEGLGTPDNNAITLQLVPYGNYNSSIGLQIVAGYNDTNTAPILYRFGYYMGPGSFTDYGMFVDSNATETGTAMVIKRGGGAQHISLSSIGTGVPYNPVISYYNSAGVATFAVRQSGEVDATSLILTPFTPASSSAPCTQGRVADDASYHYVCVAANTWKRVALTGF